MRRTSEKMRASGVSAAGVALVLRCVELLDTRWVSQAKFVAHVTECHPKLKVSTKQLSRELGSSRRPQGPDWAVAELIVDHCTGGGCRPEDGGKERDQVKAEVAGLYAVARGVPEIKGYAGRIRWPESGDGATHLNHRLAEAEAHLAEQAAEREVLSGRVTELEQENGRLAEQVLLESARHAATQQELRRLHAKVRGREEVISDHTARLKDQSVRARAAEQRLENLRERYALLAANTEALAPAGGTTPAGPSAHLVHRSGLPLARTIDAGAPAHWRALAVYLHVHQDQSERPLTDVATGTGLPLAQLELFLTARELPTLATAEVIAAAVGAQAATVRRLHDAATSEPVSAAGDSDILRERFRAIYADAAIDAVDGDSRTATDVPFAARIATEFGDTAGPAAAVSPPGGDMAWVPTGVTVDLPPRRRSRAANPATGGDAGERNGRDQHVHPSQPGDRGAVYLSDNHRVWVQWRRARYVAAMVGSIVAAAAAAQAPAMVTSRRWAPLWSTTSMALSVTTMAACLGVMAAVFLGVRLARWRTCCLGRHWGRHTGRYVYRTRRWAGRVRPAEHAVATRYALPTRPGGFDNSWCGDDSYGSYPHRPVAGPRPPRQRSGEVMAAGSRSASWAGWR